MDMEEFLHNIVDGTNEFNEENKTAGSNPTTMLAASTLGMYAVTASSASRVKPKLDYDDEFNVVFMYDTGAKGYSEFYEGVIEATDFIFNYSEKANVYFIELDKPDGSGLSYSAKGENEATGYVDGVRYDFHDSFLRDRHFQDASPSKGDRSIVISDALDFIANGTRNRDDTCTQIIDNTLPTLCFSFFSEDSAVYRSANGEDLIGELSDNVFINLIGTYNLNDYDAKSYVRKMYGDKGDKTYSLGNEEDELGDWLLKYIYAVDEIPELTNRYPMILSTGLDYVELAEPITIEYIKAASYIDSRPREEFAGYADTDDDDLFDFEEIDMRSDLIKTGNGRIELPTVGECLEHYGEKYFYVEGGLERFYRENKNDKLSSSDARTLLLKTKVLPILSNPDSKDSDGDGLPDNEKSQTKWGWFIKDPNVLKGNNFIPFGTKEYFDSLKEKVESFVYESSLDRTYISEMMKQVNSAELYDYIPFEYWDEFCIFFNNKVNNVYSYEINNDTASEIVDQELHYFRNKLNRAPETLNELIEEHEKWELLPPRKSMYHMYDTIACYDEIDGTYKGEFNLKFVSEDGKYEAVYNYKGELLDENNDPTNMGTYNFGSPNDNPTAHIILDVLPYSDEPWYSILGTIDDIKYDGDLWELVNKYFPKGWYNVRGESVECKYVLTNYAKYHLNEDAKYYRKMIKGKMN